MRILQKQNSSRTATLALIFLFGFVGSKGRSDDNAGPDATDSMDPVWLNDKCQEWHKLGKSEHARYTAAFVEAIQKSAKSDDYTLIYLQPHDPVTWRGQYRAAAIIAKIQIAKFSHLRGGYVHFHALRGEPSPEGQVYRAVYPYVESERKKVAEVAGIEVEDIGYFRDFTGNFRKDYIHLGDVDGRISMRLGRYKKYRFTPVAVFRLKLEAEKTATTEIQFTPKIHKIDLSRKPRFLPELLFAYGIISRASPWWIQFGPDPDQHFYIIERSQVGRYVRVELGEKSELDKSRFPFTRRNPQIAFTATLERSYGVRKGFIQYDASGYPEFIRFPLSGYAEYVRKVREPELATKFTSKNVTIDPWSKMELGSATTAQVQGKRAKVFPVTFSTESGHIVRGVLKPWKTETETGVTVLDQNAGFILQAVDEWELSVDDDSNLTIEGRRKSDSGGVYYLEIQTASGRAKVYLDGLKLHPRDRILDVRVRPVTYKAWDSIIPIDIQYLAHADQADDTEKKKRPTLKTENAHLVLRINRSGKAEIVSLKAWENTVKVADAVAASSPDQ